MPHDEICRRPDAEPYVDLPSEARGRLRATRRSAVARSRNRQPGHELTAVLLDMGGVVIPSLFESAAVPGFPAGPLGADEAWRSVERGDVEEREYWAEVARRHSDVDLETLWRTCSYVRIELRTALGLLASRLKLVAFTNDMAYWFGDRWEQRFPELALFDTVLEATRLGVSKPDPEAFRTAARAIAEAPERCLFVDDLEVNCAGARQAGMQTLLFDVRNLSGSVEALLAALDLGSERVPGRVFRVARPDLEQPSCPCSPDSPSAH